MYFPLRFFFLWSSFQAHLHDFTQPPSMCLQIIVCIFQSENLKMIINFGQNKHLKII